MRDMYNIKSDFLSAPNDVQETILVRFWSLLHLLIRVSMCSFHVRNRSKVIPRKVVTLLYSSSLGSIPNALNNLTWVFPGEIRNLHSLAHSSIACNVICIILTSSSIVVPVFQIVLSSAICERSTLCYISTASTFCLRESPFTLNSVGLRTALCGDPFSCSWNSAYASSILTSFFCRPGSLLSISECVLSYNIL